MIGANSGLLKRSSGACILGLKRAQKASISNDIRHLVRLNQPPASMFRTLSAITKRYSGSFRGYYFAGISLLPNNIGFKFAAGFVKNAAVMTCIMLRPAMREFGSFSSSTSKTGSVNALNASRIKRLLNREEPVLLSDFASSSSRFAEFEEIGLRIEFKKATHDSLFQTRIDNDELSANAKEFILENIDENKIIEYNPHTAHGFSKIQQRFLGKLRRVILNNKDGDGVRDEKHIDKLASMVVEVSDLDDEIEFSSQPCNLRLQIGEKKFAARADQEGRCGEGLIWILHEYKHEATRSYKAGDIQLVACMIAAWQEDYRLANKSISQHRAVSFPRRIFGIKFVGDMVTFYVMNFPKTYIVSLRSGLPVENLLVEMTEPFRLAEPKDRLCILQTLAIIRKESLLVEKVENV